MKRLCALTLALATILITAAPLAILAEEGDIALPAGTQLLVKLTNTLSTKGSEDGDPWTGKVEEPIWAKGMEVIPANSTVRGRVTFVKPEGRAKGRGEMRLVAETISTTEQGTFTIVAQLKNADDNKGSKVKDDEGTIQGPGKSAKETAKDAGIGAAVGAGGGVMVHGGTGALYGMAIGAVAGVVYGMAKKHQGVLLPPGTEFTFVLNQTFLTKRVTPPPAATPPAQ